MVIQHIRNAYVNPGKKKKEDCLVGVGNGVSQTKKNIQKLYTNYIHAEKGGGCVCVCVI